MKRRVNLFSQRIDNQTGKRYVLYGKRVTYGVLLVGVVSLISLFGLYVYLNNNLAKLNTTKSTYNRYILANQSFNQEIQKFVSKFALLKRYMQTDADGFAYYQKLQEIVQPIGVADKIDTFSIDTTHTVKYSFKVSTYDEGLQVLAFFEKPEVLEHFETLTLESFEITQNAGVYTMSFDGIMNPLE